MDCPHCSKKIEGAVSQEVLRERLAAKDTESTALKTALTEAREKAKAAERLPEVERELNAIKAERQREEAFSAAGLPADPKVRAGFAAMYDSAMAGVAEAERKPFGDWLVAEEARTHPLLATHYPATGAQGAGAGAGAAGAGTQAGTGAQGAGAGAGAAGAGAQRTHASIDAGTGGAPAGTLTIKTPDDLAKFFNSAEYRALPPEKQRETMTDLRAKLARGA